MSSKVIPLFDGATYDPDLDRKRLVTQLQAVRGHMLASGWQTIPEIRAAIGFGTPQSISARLRDLRKTKHGSFIVDRRRRGAGVDGLWEYRVRARTVATLPKVKRPHPDVLDRGVLAIANALGVPHSDPDVQRVLDWLLSEVGI